MKESDFVFRRYVIRSVCLISASYLTHPIAFYCLYVFLYVKVNKVLRHRGAVKKCCLKRKKIHGILLDDYSYTFYLFIFFISDQSKIAGSTMETDNICCGAANTFLAPGLSGQKGEKKTQEY